MPFPDFLILFPDFPLLSFFVWILLIVLMLYLARFPAHRAIKLLGCSIRNGMRLISKSILLAEKRLAQRNKEVLLAAGRNAVERLIEREFYRVDAVVKRDLSGYPALQLALSDQVTRIEEDYQRSAELPPPPPTWVNAVEAVAKISSKGDINVSNILQEIHKTIDSQYRNTMEDYRKSMNERHFILRKMVPYWRKLTQKLDEVSKTIVGLKERAGIIDNRMEEYEEIRAKTDKAERILSSSAMTQFFISGLVLLIAIGGAIINFNLIALPMSEMVGGSSYIGQFKTSNVAALVIILVEAAMGLYLMESLRITNLFPVIGLMDDKMRIRMIWITFGILMILAGVESALAFMREGIAADLQALRHSLANGETLEPVNSWIPTAGQMVMGFILPFALTFVAIPLESFVHASRAVAGVVAAAALRGFAFLLRLIGAVAYYASDLMIKIYDLFIVPPLWIEKLIQGKDKETEVSPQEEAT